MRLVFITRKVDRKDTRTGFVFDWIGKLSSKLDHLYVICQEKGDTSGLPGNVEVHSLGKEKSRGKLYQGYKLFVMSYQFGRKTQGIFCHMMPIYAIVAWLPAKLTGKKLVLWYTHKSVDLKLKIATALVYSVLTASKESFRLSSKKVKVVGHGIDVEKFLSAKTSNRSLERREFKIVSVGRISSVKDYESLIKAAEILVNDEGQKDVQVDIYGKPAMKEDFSYLVSLKEFVRNAGLENNVFFRGGVSHEEMPKIYDTADLSVNMSQTGSLDKALLESAAAGRIVLTSNDASVIPLQKISNLLIFSHDDPKLLARQILKLKLMSAEDREVLEKRLHTWVNLEHNLDNLVERIVTEFK